jgi:putative phosphoesterase
MTVTVFSDSHGREAKVREMISRVTACGQKPSEVLFLGDGLSDLSAVDHPIVAVRGNCDMFFSADVPEERVLELCGYRIIMFHGHTMGVKHGMLQALLAAVRADADILLYGHTHERHAETFAAGKSYMGVKFEKTLHVFNPGSLADGYFGCLTLRDNGVLMSHGDLYDR